MLCPEISPKRMFRPGRHQHKQPNRFCFCLPCAFQLHALWRKFPGAALATTSLALTGKEARWFRCTPVILKEADWISSFLSSSSRSMDVARRNRTICCREDLSTLGPAVEKRWFRWKVLFSGRAPLSVASATKLWEAGQGVTRGRFDIKSKLQSAACDDHMWPISHRLA